MRDSIFNRSEEIKSLPFNYSNSKLYPEDSSEQIFNYEIRTDKYFMLVTNNRDDELNLKITYNRYSEALEIDENKTIGAHIPPHDEVLLKDSGFSRDLGCLHEDCTVSIISSEKL